MSRDTKILLAVVGGVLGLCLIACIAGVVLFAVAGGALFANVAQSVNQDPADVLETAGEIADIDLPDQFTEATSMNVLGMKLAIWNDPSGESMAMLLQMPFQSRIDQDIIGQMEEQMSNQSGRRLRNVTSIEERDLTIRGAPAHMLILVGEDVDTGEQFNQLMVTFQGKGGVAMLMMLNPASEDNIQMYENVVNSIR